MSTEESMEIQRNIAVKYLLDHLDEQARISCLKACRSRSFTKGEILVAQGDDCQSLLIVTSGEVARQKYTTGGDFTTLDVCGGGEVLGAECFLAEQNHFAYEIEALSSGSLLSLSKETYSSLVERHPQLRDNLQMVLAAYIQRQDIRIDILSQRSIRQKIASYLLSQVHSSQDDLVCEMPGSKEVTARYFALPRQSLSRELLAMEKERLILVSARHVTVLDYDSLVRIVDET